MPTSPLPNCSRAASSPPPPPPIAVVVVLSSSSPQAARNAAVAAEPPVRARTLRRETGSPSLSMVLVMLTLLASLYPRYGGPMEADHSRIARLSERSASSYPSQLERPATVANTAGTTAIAHLATVAGL